MTSTQGKRFTFVFLIVAVSSIAVGLIVFALKQNINLYFTPTQVVQGEAKGLKRIRAGGLVVEGSVVRDQTLGVRFVLTDHQHNLRVSYQGILPDLFREGQGIVAMGVVTEKNELIADEVLAKHDENYMPPEVAKTVKSPNG